MGDPESHFLVTFELLSNFRGFGGSRRSAASQIFTFRTPPPPPLKKGLGGWLVCVHSRLRSQSRREILIFSNLWALRVRRASRRWIPKLQFWHPPLRFGSQFRIPKPLFFLGFPGTTASEIFT